MKCINCPCDWWWCRTNQDCLLFWHEINRDTVQNLPPKTIQTSKKPKKSRSKISAKTRQLVYTRDGHKCLKCGSIHNLTIDHIVPVSRGGKEEINNYQTLCEDCNQNKSTAIKDYRK